MEISVIIPVYYAAAFVEKAVESALQFDEVKEVLLVEDASPDNALEICQELEKKHERVKLFQHSDKKNHGAGASRNLGIKNATCPFIAFLDADDFYLPNRFDADKRVFEENHEAGGVYNAIDYHYYSEEGERKFNEIGFKGLVTINGKVSPEELPLVFLNFHKIKGSIHLNSLTVKTELIARLEGFNEKLRLHQDTDFTIKLSILGKLFPGEIEKPVAMYGAHGENRITANKNVYKTRALFYHELKKWSKANAIAKDLIKIIEAHYIENKVLGSNYWIALFFFKIGMFSNKVFLLKNGFFNRAAKKIFGSGLFYDFFVRLKEKIQISVLKIPLTLDSYDYSH